MLMWAMSDRAIPRSYATMEGFGVHTFRLIADDGSTSLVKFHWKPVAGVHGLVWEEAQKIAGVDPDFHRRDLYERIEAGNFPQWELGVQVMPDSEDQMFEGIDLLDSTKIVPEELCPVRPIGVLTLHAQRRRTSSPRPSRSRSTPVTWCRASSLTDDPLLHARLFSYLDTQLTRLGGPNFSQLPINQPLAPVNDNHRDGMHQTAVHTGVAPYAPNSLGGGCPFAGSEGAYVHHPQPASGARIRVRPQSFDDHFSQAAMFFRSLTPVEQDHLVGAFRFELGKCLSPVVVERMLTNLAAVDGSLCAEVASAPRADASDGLGVRRGPAVAGVVDAAARPGSDRRAQGRGPRRRRHRSGRRRRLAGSGGPGGRRGRHRRAALRHPGRRGRGRPHDAHHGVGRVRRRRPRCPPRHEGSALFVQEAYRHHKTVGAIEAEALDPLGIPAGADGVEEDPPTFMVAMGWHRHWDRPGLVGVTVAR